MHIQKLYLPNQNAICLQRKKSTFIDPTEKIILLSARISKEITLILSEHLSDKKASNFLVLYQCP